MTSTLRTLRTFATAAAMALYATAASPQSAGAPQVQDHQGHAEAAPPQGGVAGMAGMPRDVMARMATLDEQIQQLVTDVHMFVGDLRVETMAALLTAIVERQSLMQNEMMRMHRGMMSRPMEKATAPASAEEVPGTMCSPSP